MRTRRRESAVAIERWQLFCFIRDFITAHRRGPTHSEISRGLKLAGSTIANHVNYFEAEGYIAVAHNERGGRDYSTIQIQREFPAVEDEMLGTTQGDAPPIGRMTSQEVSTVRGQLFNFLRDFVAAHGHGPTLPEMAKALGLRVGRVWYHIQFFKAMGYITVQGSDYRTLKILVPYGMGDDAEVGLATSTIASPADAPTTRP